ncbi:hypothetical protein [Hafnia paralvei]|nr:hypothetical protein [Hafnia paralvei]
MAAKWQQSGSKVAAEKKLPNLKYKKTANAAVPFKKIFLER